MMWKIWVILRFGDMHEPSKYRYVILNYKSGENVGYGQIGQRVQMDIGIIKL